MAQQEYNFRCRGCKTTKQGMEKLKDSQFKYEQVDEGEDDLIAFTQVKNPFCWRFFGIFHKQEDDILITGVFETTAVIKVIISVIVFFIAAIIFTFASIQYDYASVMLPLYSNGMSPQTYVIAKYGVYAFTALTILFLAVYTAWLCQTGIRKAMIEDIEKIMGSKVTKKY
ncbi:MAG TPA: hypothetical protein DCG28_05640 [Lachnospiraceae bacterium]|nr:hypothetical protein [Lachnospiraceae bacterium]